MCGRFASTLPLEQIARLFSITGELPNIAPNWNTAPTQSAAVVRRHYFNGERAETVATSGMFRGALAARRCLVNAEKLPPE